MSINVLSKVLFLTLVIGSISYIGISKKNHSNKDEHTDHAEDAEHGENSLELSEIAIELGGISTQVASNRIVKSSVKINGRIVPNQDQFAHINPRFPGVVRVVNVSLGETVKKGQTLATIESNGSLSRYPVKTKMSGVVVMKNVAQGEFVGHSKVMFTVANLDTVWIDLSVSEADFSKISLNQKVIVYSWESDSTIESRISYVSPVVYKDSQTILARTIIENKEGSWRPGLFVSAKVITDDSVVGVAVNKNAVQILESKKVVFVTKDEEHFEARPVKLGRIGAEFIEVLSGLSKGERYVSENSYILKADLLKSQAEHVH